MTQTIASDLDPAAVLADPRARRTLAELAGALRRAGLDFGRASAPGPDAAAVRRLAGGAPVSVGRLASILGLDGDDLVAAGLADPVGADGVAMRFGLFVVDGVAAVVPKVSTEADRVYLGADSAWLLSMVWRRTARLGRVADLGTGTGFLAAALARRASHVVATDLYRAPVTTAALTALVNPDLAGRLHVVQADVARGLRAGAFDLVTANVPWVPSGAAHEVGDRPVAYADGGPTGFELPERFLDEAPRLLAPGGLAAVLCLDGTLSDGGRPIGQACDRLERLGFEVELRPTAAAIRHPDLAATARRRLPGLADARHVCVLVHRP